MNVSFVMFVQSNLALFGVLVYRDRGFVYTVYHPFPMINFTFRRRRRLLGCLTDNDLSILLKGYNSKSHQTIMQ